MNFSTSLIKIESGKNASSVPGKYSNQSDIDTLFFRVVDENDYEAFQTLFTKMYSPLCQFCVKFVQVNEVAEELVSDVFYTIWKNRSQIIVSTPRAYLFTAVKNRGFDHLRRIKKSLWVDIEKASEITDNHNSEDHLIGIELAEQIDRAVAALPKQCRLIFELSRDHGMKYKEIASTLNIGVKTVETQIGRALKHLRNSLPNQ
jgi:RNA polymerase sigma-70 factor (ECF subfamily)